MSVHLLVIAKRQCQKIAIIETFTIFNPIIIPILIDF